MSTLHNFAIGSDAAQAEFSPVFDSYTRVTILVDEETEITAGNDIGRELIVNCPWGTESMAENILLMLSGYQYQPYSAKDALLDPAAEIGDAVTIRGTMGGIYSQEIDFGPLMLSALSAPEDEEIDHEYPYVSPAERTIRRVKKDTEAQLAVHEEEISAKVNRLDGNTSFGWSLTDTQWILTSGNKTVLKADQSGIEISGKVTALSGYIGSGNNGFVIGERAIYNGMLSFQDEENNGIYLGTDGIALGKGSFKVDSQGNLVARSATLTGTINATGGTIGSGNSVFAIGGNAIKNGMTSLYDTSHSGIYLGTDGIALGGGKFRVDANGDLIATSGRFTGETYASSIKSDGVHGYGGSFSGSGLSSGSVSKGKTGFQSTLSQVGTNQADIAAIQKMFVGTLSCNVLVASASARLSNPELSNAVKIKGKYVKWMTYQGYAFLSHD